MSNGLRNVHAAIARYQQGQERLSNIPSNRGRAAWGMAQTPEQQQQWIAWANNPQAHDPKRTASDNSGNPYTPYTSQDQISADLRQQVYGQPAQPAAQPVPDKRRVAMGRMLRGK